MCPALILANNRKHKVIGRTKILTISTNLRKGTKYQGELTGKREAIQSFFNASKKIVSSHIVKATLKLKAKVVVTGYLKTDKEIKLSSANKEKNEKKLTEAPPTKGNNLVLNKSNVFPESSKKKNQVNKLMTIVEKITNLRIEKFIEKE